MHWPVGADACKEREREERKAGPTSWHAALFSTPLRFLHLLIYRNPFGTPPARRPGQPWNHTTEGNTQQHEEQLHSTSTRRGTGARTSASASTSTSTSTNIRTSTYECKYNKRTCRGKSTTTTKTRGPYWTILGFLEGSFASGGDDYVGHFSGGVSVNSFEINSDNSACRSRIFSYGSK